MQKEKQKLEEQIIQDRISTFSEEWPYTDSDSNVPNVSILAEAGFYFLGLNDSVQCSACEIVVNGWDGLSEKDPWIQHAKISPNCSFLEKSKGSSWIQEVLE